MAKEKIILIGASAAAVQVHFELTHDSNYEVAAFTVDQKYIQEQTLSGLPVVPFENVEHLYPPDQYRAMVAIYAGRVNRTRAEKYLQAKAKGYRFINFISSRASTWPDLKIGENCYVGESAICRPYVTIGNNVFLMPGAIVGHYSVVGDHCFVGTGVVLLGAAKIEPYCVVGANATILDGVTVKSEGIIGAGCVIHEETQPKGVYRAGGPTLLPLPSDKLGKFVFVKHQ